tara:strand:- start:438 stop:815 length:378 start_codon:yes stop_codon:yes gene_type:complete
MNWGKYFTQNEFKCSHTQKCEMNQDFINKLNELRKAYGRPMRITSGFRDVTHPIEARKKNGGGAHTTGCAADIGVARGDAFDLVSLALAMKFTGIGINQKGDARFIHLDTLENTNGRPRPTIWSY